MTWFAHRCWFCGHKHKDVDLLLNDAYSTKLKYQCKFFLREACETRREAKGVIGRADYKVGQRMGWWTEWPLR